MSHLQGTSLLWLRRSALVSVTLHGLEGAKRDADGIWRGLDDIDPASYRRLDDWDQDADGLCSFLRDALLASRYLVPIRPEWFSLGVGYDRIEENARLAAAFGYASARSLFTGMKSCVLARELDVVRFTPRRRRHSGQFEAFEPAWIEGHEAVAIGWSDRPPVWLNAARLCFSRCL